MVRGFGAIVVPFQGLISGFVFLNLRPDRWHRDSRLLGLLMAFALP